MGKLDGKSIIVTGAAQGLGREYSIRLAQDGARLAIADIKDCGETAERIQMAGGEVMDLSIDVSSEEQMLELARRTNERYGRIHGLLNNAGITRVTATRSIMDVDMAAWDRIYAVHARGTFLGIRAVFPYMKEAGGGTIVNVSSGSILRISRAADEVNVAYVSSKSAIMGITRAVARELGAHNINVVTLAPGSTTADRDDPLSADEAFDEPDASLLRRGVPSDLSGVVAFLFSDDAQFISGQMIVVNGGREVY